MRSVWMVLGLAFALRLGAAAPLPPPPARHLADTAGILSPAARNAIAAQLETFERESSSQVVVWIDRKLPPNTVLEEHVNAVFRHWKIGQARTNNGILLAIFVDDRRLRIEVGRGLEGALPDALAGRIIRNDIEPRFRNKDFDGGVRAGVSAIIAATRGEYRGTGTTQGDRTRSGSRQPPGFFLVVLVFVVVMTIVRFLSMRRNRVWNGSGWTYSGGGWDSGGGGGGGGGGFSGGGGDSGGGGASGSW